MKLPSLLLSLLLALTAAAARDPLDRPNIILVFLDDSGYGDFAHTGNPTVHTPNITRLARDGAIFPQFYSASPACSASRYAILTGRTPGRSGLGRWVIGPNSERYLHPREITLAEGLKSRGYATGFFGKWHLGTPNNKNGQSPDSLPLAHGFDTWTGTDVSHDYDDSRLIRSSENGDTPIPGYELIARNLPKNSDVADGLTQLYTTETLRFIHEKKDQPFFIYLAPNMPHLGLNVSDEFRGKSRRGLFGDVMEEIDDSIGRIVKELAAENLLKNTLLIFTSDNGPWLRFRDTVDHPKYGEARLHIGYAHPFRDGKGSTWEGGHRVPAIFWWPGTIPPETVVHDPASALDVLPTLFHLVDIPLPTDRTIDGRNIAFYLNSSRFPDDPADFVFPYSGPDNTAFALRQGPWKIHVRLTSQIEDDHGFSATRETPLLFQLEHDPGERIDRAAEHPEIVKTLLQSLADYEQSLRANAIFWNKESGGR